MSIRQDSEPRSRHPAPRLWVAPSEGATAVLRQARRLFRDEGPCGLARGLGRFTAALWHRAYRVEHFILNRLDLAVAASVFVKPPLDDISFHVIENRDDLERLKAEGYEDIVSIVPRFLQRLDSGAVAGCAFVGKEFASVDWMAFSERAKLSVDLLPYRVDFESGEACTCGAWTSRRFRARGIGTYRFSQQMRYMKDHGTTVCWNAIAIGNTASQRPVDRHGGQHCRIARYRRILWWESWKETPAD